MTDPIQQIEERYGKGKPSVGLPQIFTDIQNLLKLVKALRESLDHQLDLRSQLKKEYRDEFINEIIEEIFGAK